MDARFLYILARYRLCAIKRTIRGTMGVMTIADAFEVLDRGAREHPGEWIERSLHTAYASARLAVALGLDEPRAYVAGLLHDIGFSRGPCGISHARKGRELLLELGEPDAARVALSHSFPSGRVSDYPGVMDDDPVALQALLDSARVDDLDRVVQLCATLSDREDLAASLAFVSGIDPSAGPSLEPRGALSASGDDSASSGAARMRRFLSLSAIKARFEARAGKRLSEVFSSPSR